jgi:hypothetical protein
MSIFSSPSTNSSTKAPSDSAATANPNPCAVKPSSASRSQSGRISSKGWSSESEDGSEFTCGCSNRSCAARKAPSAAAYSSARSWPAMSMLTLRVPPSLLEMIEPREAKARMPGTSRKRSLKAAISASTSRGRFGSATTHRPRALTLRLTVASGGKRLSPPSKLAGSASTSAASSALIGVAMRCISARL